MPVSVCGWRFDGLICFDESSWLFVGVLECWRRFDFSVTATLTAFLKVFFDSYYTCHV